MFKIDIKSTLKRSTLILAILASTSCTTQSPKKLIPSEEISKEELSTTYLQDLTKSSESLEQALENSEDRFTAIKSSLIQDPSFDTPALRLFRAFPNKEEIYQDMTPTKNDKSIQGTITLSITQNYLHNKTKINQKDFEFIEKIRKALPQDREPIEINDLSKVTQIRDSFTLDLEAGNYTITQKIVSGGEFQSLSDIEKILQGPNLPIFLAPKSNSASSIELTKYFSANVGEIHNSQKSKEIKPKLNYISIGVMAHNVGEIPGYSNIGKGLLAKTILLTREVQDEEEVISIYHPEIPFNFWDVKEEVRNRFEEGLSNFKKGDEKKGKIFEQWMIGEHNQILHPFQQQINRLQEEHLSYLENSLPLDPIGLERRIRKKGQETEIEIQTNPILFFEGISYQPKHLIGMVKGEEIAYIQPILFETNQKYETFFLIGEKNRVNYLKEILKKSGGQSRIKYIPFLDNPSNMVHHSTYVFKGAIGPVIEIKDHERNVWLSINQGYEVKDKDRKSGIRTGTEIFESIYGLIKKLSP
jgi:hypothetical protein